MRKRSARHVVLPFAALVVLFAAVAAIPADSATGAGRVWSITPNPKVSQHEGLFGVSCPSATSCFAVGSRLVGSPIDGVGRALIQHWNGDHWSVMRGAAVPAGANVMLNAVACPSTNSCFAVGTDGSAKYFIEHWSGDHWNVMRAPIQPGAASVRLNGISCPGANSCSAVGTDDSRRSVIVHWDGGDWEIEQTTTPGRNFPLYAVSCPGRKSCFAVGSYGYNPIRTLVKHWNGLQWVTKASPNPSGSVSSGFTGVSCPSLQSCFAVGTTDIRAMNGTLIERWNGASWSIMNAPIPSRGMALDDISCPSTETCFAVGHDESGRQPTYSTVVERWVRGAPWSRMPSPNPAGDAYLRGVTCRDTTSCFAVGNSSVDFNNGPYRSLIERYK